MSIPVCSVAEVTSGECFAAAACVCGWRDMADDGANMGTSGRFRGEPARAAEGDAA